MYMAIMHFQTLVPYTIFSRYSLLLDKLLLIFTASSLQQDLKPCQRKGMSTEFSARSAETQVHVLGYYFTSVKETAPPISKAQVLCSLLTHRRSSHVCVVGEHASGLDA